MRIPFSCMARPWTFAILIWVASISCSTSREIRKSPVFQASHTGFALYDLEEKKFVELVNADKYFTPASNTKIFTLWAGLKILDDSVPAFRFVKKGDSLILSGTGDPTFLNPSFESKTTYDFLDQWSGKLFLTSQPIEGGRFGPGWAWDDYPYSYSVEKAAFSIYGNTIEVVKHAGESEVRVSPRYFTDFMTYYPPDTAAVQISRSEFKNQIEFHQQPLEKEVEAKIPFVYSDSLLARLLSDTLKRPVEFLNSNVNSEFEVFYSQPVDSVYKIMMQQSDNFIAEQILLLCASKLSDSLSSRIPISYMMKNWLNDLPDPPNWVDGSGLSRYNMVTPRTIIRLWEKIYYEVPRSRLFALLAQGGKTGTLTEWYKSDSPFIFGKTGTLSNNHCLSGFLISRKGNTYIFSFMNSHYVRETSEIKREMERILKEIHNRR